jgi:hypothetical protein
MLKIKVITWKLRNLDSSSFRENILKVDIVYVENVQIYSNVISSNDEPGGRTMFQCTAHADDNNNNNNNNNIVIIIIKSVVPSGT